MRSKQRLIILIALGLLAAAIWHFEFDYESGASARAETGSPSGDDGEGPAGPADDQPAPAAPSAARRDEPVHRTGP